MNLSYDASPTVLCRHKLINVLSNIADITFNIHGGRLVAYRSAQKVTSLLIQGVNGKQEHENHYYKCTTSCCWQLQWKTDNLWAHTKCNTTVSCSGRMIAYRLVDSANTSFFNTNKLYVNSSCFIKINCK